MSTLHGRIALITGASGGLGSFVTQAFLNQGATVAGVSRSARDSDFASDRFAAFPAELSSGEAAATLVNQVVARFSRIDVLVHLVGGFAGGRVDETDDKTLEQMFDLNFRSAFYITRAVLPQMRAQGAGRIVAIGSRFAVEANAGVGIYSASKAALIALMRAVALENKDKSITANVVLPATMDTPANRKAMPHVDPNTWVQPEQVASLIVGLASDAYTQVNGAAIPIYGSEL